MGQITPEIEKNYLTQVKEIEKIYVDMLKNFDVTFPKPLNLKSEKKIFFQKLADDEVYNPLIKYEKKEIDLEKINLYKKRIKKISTSNDLYGLKKLYKKRLKTKLIQIRYQKNWGNQSCVKDVMKYWGEPDYFLLRKAKKICLEYKREKVKFTRLTNVKFANELKKEVYRLTRTKIKVRYDNIHSKMNIEPYMKIIEINKNERFTSLDLERLKIHEIGVHYLRYYNGHKMNVKILETGTANYLETEEGLAAYAENEKGVLSKAQMFVYAGRVIATHYALKKSFYEVFQILKKYGFTNKVAFAITYRSKRCLNDTSLKGSFTKDYVYLKGFYSVSQYAKKYEIKDLFIGKIGIDDVKLVQKFINKNKHRIISIFDNI